ncbi:MAG: hypothetical protein M1133_10820 [Armatimonadetes bacterium]|nr:hypothetical protein [Armatimonadota bacterium]
MLKAFYTWDPVSAGTYRAFNEPAAYANNKWFFDKSVWQKMFRAMSGCGFDALILANTHPSPFMIDLASYPDAKIIGEPALMDYQRMHHWIFETALDYDIASYLLFFNIYMPERLLAAQGIDASQARVPSDFSLEYTHHCVRELLETYPELVGLIADVGSNLAGDVGVRPQFVQQAIVDAVDAARPDVRLYLRGWEGAPEEIVGSVKRRGGRQVGYFARYTRDCLVDAGPDSEFNAWVEAAGAENIIADFQAANVEPWTCFSFDTVEEIVENLNRMECEGFALRPLSVADWPRTSDEYFKFQWQRDLVWYSAWGGTSVEQLLRSGLPKWLLRNSRLMPGFSAGSRILELLALYFAPQSGYWGPQFCSIWDADASVFHLLSVADMLGESGGVWWQDVTGDRAVRLAEYVRSGTPEDSYGPDELIEELADLSEQAVSAGEKGMRSASGEKELPSLARDAFCTGRLGEFYVERLKAALAHARGDDAEAVEHMNRALGLYREIRGVDNSHRGPITIVVGREAVEYTWTTTLKALEAELADASNGRFGPGCDYAC